MMLCLFVFALNESSRVKFMSSLCQCVTTVYRYFISIVQKADRVNCMSKIFDPIHYSRDAKSEAREWSQEFKLI